MKTNEVSQCIFSTCRTWRYSLMHSWGEGAPEKSIVWIGLNPSTADENHLDPTLRRVRGFSRLWGYNSFIMLNLFAFRATRPADLFRASNPIGPDNDAVIAKIAAINHDVICAWGAAGRGSLCAARVCAVLDILAANHCRCLCLAKTKAGIPRHPLYLEKNLLPVPLLEPE